VKKKRKIAGRFSRGYSGAWCRVCARLNANFPTVSILHPTGPQGRNSIFQRWPPPNPRWASRPRATPLHNRKKRARARTHTYRIRAYYDDIRHRDTLCPRKFLNARRWSRSRSVFRTVSLSISTPDGEHSRAHRTHVRTRAYVKPRLKFRLLDPR